MIFSKIKDYLFPRRCAICDDVICSSEYICKKCGSKIRYISGDTCIKCGKSIQNSSRLYCYDCSRKIHIYDKGYSVFEYNQIKNSLYRFKYSGRAEYARYYAYTANSHLGTVLRGLGADALIPVPIHKKRLKERGYNQAEVFANELSKLLNIPVYNDYLIRKKATVPLKLLDVQERANNLKKAFIIRPNSVELETIIIIDDIYTTGATIDEISRVLRDNGVQKIYFLTVASGSGLL